MLTINQGFTRAYTDILKAAPPSYRTILLHLANEPSKPLIVHCTAGKDRTGVICALVLSLCGVDDEVVANEYSLTEIGLPAEWKESVIEHLMENSAMKGDMASALNMIGAKYVSCLSFFEPANTYQGGSYASNSANHPREIWRT